MSVFVLTVFRRGSCNSWQKSCLVPCRFPMVYVNRRLHSEPNWARRGRTRPPAKLGLVAQEKRQLESRLRAPLFACPHGLNCFCHPSDLFHPTIVLRQRTALAPISTYRVWMFQWEPEQPRVMTRIAFHLSSENL